MNDALGAAGRAHRAMFERLGYEFLEINFAKEGAQEILNRAVKDGSIEFAFGVMGMGAEIGGVTADGKDVNLWEAIRVPFIGLFGDTPAYYFDRHVVANPWHASLYFYPEHLELRNRLRKPTAALYGVVPPIPFGLTEKREIDFQRKAQGRLVFLKNGNDPEKLVRFWRGTMPEPTFLFLAELASELAAGVATETGYDIDAFVCNRFSDKGWDIAQFLKLRLFFVAQLDDYLRRIKSTMMGNVLSDFPVDIRGFNWEHVDFSRGRATYGPGIDYTETRATILGSLGIIDMSPNTQRAPHDRPMRAFGLSTFCLTNEQRFFTETFPNFQLFSFRFEPDHLREQVAAVLASPKRYVELGIEVADTFCQRYRQEDFGQYLIDTASHIRLACGPRPPGAQDFFVWPPTIFA